MWEQKKTPQHKSTYTIDTTLQQVETYPALASSHPVRCHLFRRRAQTRFTKPGATKANIQPKLRKCYDVFKVLIKWKLKEFQITSANILFTAEHREHKKSLKWDILQLYPINELISHMMHATCLRIVAQWHVYHDVASLLLLKTVWRRLGFEVMSFWRFGCNLVPFLPRGPAQALLVP